MSDLIERQAAIKAIENLQDCYNGFSDTYDKACIIGALEEVPSAQPEPIKVSVDREMTEEELKELKKKIADSPVVLLPSAQPEQRYTEEELRVFQHGISLSLLSKRSSQHWQYDEDTATEIKFLERLYEKVGADMRGEEV